MGKLKGFLIESAGQPPGATGTAVNKRHGGSATPKIV